MAESLSEPARRILELLATGLSTAEAAGILGISPEEVHRDLLRAMMALGASSKLEAMITAIREGLIDLPQST